MVYQWARKLEEESSREVVGRRCSNAVCGSESVKRETRRGRWQSQLRKRGGGVFSLVAGSLRGREKRKRNRREREKKERKKGCENKKDRGRGASSAVRDWMRSNVTSVRAGSTERV